MGAIQEKTKIDQWTLKLEEHETAIADLLFKAEDGEELEVFCQLKEYKKLIDQALKQVEPHAFDGCDLHSPNNAPFVNNGYEIQKRNGGRLVDFSNVPEVSTKETELKTLKEKLKHAFEGLEKGTTMLSGEQMVLSDGELVNLPTWKHKKDSIIVKKL